jgi:integrator complex subunit 11
MLSGDFNTVPDRHLPGASLPKLRPNLLISESTYATSLREGRRTRERQLMALVGWTAFAGCSHGCNNAPAHLVGLVTVAGH